MIGIPVWCFSLPETEYQSCSPTRVGWRCDFWSRCSWERTCPNVAGSCQGKLLAVHRGENCAAWRHWPLGQRCGFDKGSIGVSEGVLGVSESHRTLWFQLVTDHEIPVTAEAELGCGASRERKAVRSERTFWRDLERHSLGLPPFSICG